jgi:hypothetical protein
MLVQILAGIVFIAFLFSLLRFALGLRYAKVAREEARREQEDAGRRVVAELPQPAGAVLLFVEDPLGFSWGQTRVGKDVVSGVRMRLNGGVLAEFVRPGTFLPAPVPPEEYDGRERWDVLLFRDDGSSLSVPCGTVREGISREVAATVFEAVKRTVAAGT